MTRSRDPILFYLTIIFLVAGILILASASLGLLGADTSPAAVVFRQVIIGFGIGLIFLFIADRIPYRFWHRAAFWVFLMSFAATLLVFVPGIGFSSGGAARWISIGPFFLQPAEFLKLSFIIYLAAWLASRGREINSLSFGILPMAIIILGVGALFIMQPDIGTLGVIMASGMILFFIGGGKMRYFTSMGILLFILFLATLYLRPYTVERLVVFVNPSFDLQGAGYQLHQAAIAFGSGGIFGKGFGQSIQKFDYLPEPAGDAIFAVIGEEFGFFGTSLLLGLFLVFLWRVFIILRRTPDLFARLLGSGIVILITSQALINMGALIGILPLTGLTMPFISQGGSSLVATLTGMGILLNISKHRGR